MKIYQDLLEHVLRNGVSRNDRTGVGTLSCFGYQVRFDLQRGFPLLTTKKMHLKSIIYELIWFLRGDTNVEYLRNHGVTIWDEWADKKGDLGPIYGKQWRQWRGYNNKVYDQISDTIELIKKQPNSRRMIVSAWNVAELELMSLSPCHCLFQFYVSNNKLSCHLYQRSADVFLGVPFNIASYSMLTMMIAQVCDLEVGDFVHSFGDLHLYNNHISQANLQLSRKPFDLPTLEMNKNITNIFSFNYEDFSLLNYKSHKAIKASIAV